MRGNVLNVSLLYCHTWRSKVSSSELWTCELFFLVVTIMFTAVKPTYIFYVIFVNLVSLTGLAFVANH